MSYESPITIMVYTSQDLISFNPMYKSIASTWLLVDQPNPQENDILSIPLGS
jgi:hypothetical protein